MNSSQVSFTQPSTIPLNSTDNVMETPVVAERSMYESEIAKVRKENAHLKDQTARLNAELRAYQVQFPYANVDTKVQGVDLPPWMEKEEVMSPLIKAYDSRISELGSITEKQVRRKARVKNEETWQEYVGPTLRAPFPPPTSNSLSPHTHTRTYSGSRSTRSLNSASTWWRRTNSCGRTS